MKCPRCDYHLHTAHIGCADKTMKVLDIIRECERLGVTSIAFTDHLNSLDQLPAHRRIREEIENIETELSVYFGAELNFAGCDQGFLVAPDHLPEMGFQFAIGGIHETYLPRDVYDLRKLVDIQHRHHLKTCEDPAVSVLVHPYWLGEWEFAANNWPLLNSMAPVPESYARELGQASRDTGTAIEINTTGCLCREGFPEDYAKEYVAYLGVMAEEGALFSTATDAHSLHLLQTINSAWEAAEVLNIPPDRIWHPAILPANRK